MRDLIEALQIFLKYENPPNPTHCEHDELTICVDPAPVSSEDKTRLKELGFLCDSERFYSFRFGSA
jgi:hypothetical protein